MADGFWEEGAHDLLHGAAVVVGQPFSELHEARGDEWLRIDEGVEVAEGEVGLGWLADVEDGAGGVAVAEGDADAAADGDGA